MKETLRAYVESTTDVVPLFETKQQTEGSPFYLGKWVKGKVMLKDKRVLTESEGILNYHKMHHKLLMKTGDKIIEVNMNEIAAFDLVEGDIKHSFVRAPFNESEYAIEVLKDSLYSLYKIINTKFAKADYVNKGVYETGYKYDRYEDEPTYYIVQKSGKTTTFKELSKKEFKQALEDIPEAKDYLKNYDKDADKELFLSDLTYYLNHQRE